MILETESKEQFGNWVRNQRKKRGWTLRDLSQKVGVTHSHPSQMERGEKEPAALVLRDIKRVFVDTYSDDPIDKIAHALSEEEIRLLKAWRQLPKVVTLQSSY